MLLKNILKEMQIHLLIFLQVLRTLLTILLEDSKNLREAFTL
jgi:hypothetical protein